MLKTTKKIRNETMTCAQTETSKPTVGERSADHLTTSTSAGEPATARRTPSSRLSSRKAEPVGIESRSATIAVTSPDVGVQRDRVAGVDAEALAVGR